MPNGGCLKCGEPILQGLKPHYCEKCLAELGLAYDDDIQLLLKDSSKSIEADLEQFEFETATVTVERSRLCIQRNSKTAQQFIEPLSGSIDLAMVKIPAGSFIMGSPNDELSRQVHEEPQHQVTLAEPFFMAKYPITKTQWNVVAALPEVRQPLPRFRASNRPVEKASWLDAVEFCARLSQHTGRSYRLPTEAEWEYACRGGTTTPFYFGETITPDVVNCKSTQPYGAAPKGESRKKTTDVGQFPANAFGLYDMHGNVWEWCQDYWHDNYDGAPTNGSAWLSPDEDEMRILRGGSYAYNPESCRSAIRGRTAPDFSYDTGLRVVCSAVKSDPSDSSEHESFDEMDILICCALRFDGYKYKEEHELFPSNITEHYLRTGQWQATKLELLTEFYCLQRALCKWDLAWEPYNSAYWRGFRELFFLLCTSDIPEEYRSEQFPECYDKWQKVFQPRLSECVAEVRRVHNSIDYLSFEE
jgi:formylglycine-generating enzyme required for sulfatase activity